LLLAKFPNAEELTSDLNQDVMKEFNILKIRHRDFLKTIRHNVAHHRDIDAIWQYYLINDIDFNWTIKAYMDFVQWYAVKFTRFEFKLIQIAMGNQNK